jgi:DNA topoisomerase-1
MTKIIRFTDPKDPLNKEKWVYKFVDGTQVNDSKILEWISSLRIPPAWTNVTIFYNMSSKQTCCGYDPAGRLQCLYTQKHITQARKMKYCDLISFGIKLPEIQNDIKRALDSTKITKTKVIALILKIVVCCNFRLGTLTYEAQNDSYGITTIRKEHVTFGPKTATIKFIGKKGVLNECRVEDEQCVNALRELAEVNKNDDHVMMYFTDGEWIHIKHTDVNNFLKKYGENFTSKDFRTFQANMLLIDGMRDKDPAALKPTQRKKVLLDVVRHVAATVHNTPAVCRKDYIDPEIIDLYVEHPIKYRSKFITPGTTSRIMFMNWLRDKCS